MAEEVNMAADLASFRQVAVKLGIITESQAPSVSFQMIRPVDLPEMLLHHTGVQRCRCPSCMVNQTFFGIAIDEAVISRLQSRALIALYSAGMSGQMENSEDCHTSKMTH